MQEIENNRPPVKTHSADGAQISAQFRADTNVSLNPILAADVLSATLGAGRLPLTVAPLKRRPGVNHSKDSMSFAAPIFIRTQRFPAGADRVCSSNTNAMPTV